MQTYIYGHGPFLGNTGYNVHTRNFFTALSKYFPTKVRNITVGDTVLTEEQHRLLGSLSAKPDINLLNIVLAETYGASYVDDWYESSKILYNVWESTKQPVEFFNKALKFDQFWVPSEWQKECAINQGYPKDKMFVVHEGVADYFKPNLDIKNNDGVFKFALIGKWEYRKATEEIIKCFLHTFKDNNKVKLLLLIDNPFLPLDTTTNLLNVGINPEDSHLQIINHVSDTQYLNLLQTSDVFISCSRSEGWNLPLMESMATGLPSICSNCSGQMEFAKYGAITVDILKETYAAFNDHIFPGNYYEPDFKQLSDIMLDVYNNYESYKHKSLEASNIIREKFSWDKAALQAKNIIDNFDFSIYTKKKNAKVATVATSINKGLDLLRDSCNKHAINLGILGSNKAWTDFYMKLDEMNVYLNNLNDEDVLLFIDGYDSYIADTLDNIVDKFIKLDCKILMSSEIICFPDLNMHSKYPPSDTKFRFLNSGGYIGYVGDIKKVITDLRIIRQSTDSIYRNNDQYLWSLYYLENRDIIKLDTKCDIFQCLHSTTVDDFELVGDRYKNKFTDTFPSVYHANGNSKNVLGELVQRNFDIKISNITLTLENEYPRFDFSYNGPDRDFICSIKNHESNEIYYSTTIHLKNNLRYFIKANKDVSSDSMLTFEALTGGQKFSENFLINKIKNCVFIITWLGVFPYWFDYFMKSCALNPDFDFLIFTDQTTDFEYPCNVIFKYMDLHAFNELINEKLYTEFKIDNFYKLCDFKAMYGYLYSESISKYKYWGFCDVDVIWGNLNTFFKPYISKDIDVITLGASTKDLHYRVAGPCTLVKNNPITNLSFYKVPKYKDVFKTQEYINFEESEWDNWLKNQKSIKFEILLESQGWENNISIDSAEWINGLLYLPSGKEIAMYHFRDKNKLFKNIEGGFKIMPKQSDLNCEILEKDPLIYITGGDSIYMPLIKILVESIAEFSKYKIVVYGYDCDIPFSNDKLIKRKLSIGKSDLTKSDGRSISYSMAKELCCLDAIEKNDAENYVWVDGDSFASIFIDDILKYSNKIVDYPLINSHIHDTIWDNNNMTQSIGQDLMNSLDIKRKHYPWLHGCLFIFNKRCKRFFEAVIEHFNKIDKSHFTILTDELLFNIMAESENMFNHMNVHDFDVFKKENFQEFLNGNYRQAYKNFTPLITGKLSDHAILPSMENDIFIFHGQKHPETLEQMFAAYVTKLQDSYFYVPHNDSIVDLKSDNSLLNFTYKEIFENKEYEKEFCHIKKGDIVVDCGANIGIFTRYAYEMGASRVISFEPAPDNYKCLIKNVPNIANDLYNVAISSKNGHKTLYLDKNAGGHSIIKEDINNTKLGTSVNIACINLDSMFDNGTISKIDFLKVDVEGAELEVFEGISDANLSKVDRIAMEYHHAKLNFDIDVRDKFLNRFQRLGFKYFILFLGDNNHLQMIYIWKEADIKTPVNQNNYIVNHHFVNGPFCEIKGGDNNTTYDINFIDGDNGQIVHAQSNMRTNHWTKANRKWFTNWKIKITNNETGSLQEINYNPRDKKVYIAVDSKALGDTLAWFPYAEEFRKKWGCKMVVSTFWNNLFEKQYPNIEFIKPGTVVNNLYAMYSIGWHAMQDYKNPRNFLDAPMQRTASDILGLDYKPIKPNIDVLESVPTEEKYVCIGIHSTCQAKYWNNKGGWQRVADYLNGAGYKVYSISKEPDGYMGNYLPKGVINMPDDVPIINSIKRLANARFFIGISSGLAWLAWAVGIPVVMISGFSSAITEFPADIRIESNSSCRNCFNKHRLDPSNWLWCPENKNFECTSSISPEYVIDQISRKFM